MLNLQPSIFNLYQATVTIAQESEVVRERIIVYASPIAIDKSTDQQEESALRLMEIGDEDVHNAIFESWCDDNLSGRM